MKSNNSLAGLFIMIGLAIFGAMIPVAVKQFRSYERTVDVKGLCEREVKADKVIWPLSHKAVSNDILEVSKTLNSNNKAIVKFLTDNGLSETEFTLSTPKITDKLAQEYVSSTEGYRYLGQAVVTVYSTQVDKVKEIMGKMSSLINRGINISQGEWNMQPRFLYESLNDIKPEMIAEATENAREAADKFAKDSGSKVGKIKRANQGTFSIEDRDECTPEIKKVRVVTSLTYYLEN